MYDTNHINDYDDWISKSQLKRESKVLHALGEEITKLSESEFDRLNFEDYDSFYKEIVFARKLLNNPQHEPYRREMLHIERMLRSIDEEFIGRLRSAVDTIKSKKVVGDASFHRLEKLREDLLGEDSRKVMDELISSNYNLDRNLLRTLISKAKQEKAEGKPLTNYRELFRYLRDNC